MKIHVGLCVFLAIILCFSQTKSENDQRSYWFGRYGLANYGRQVSEGTFQGSLSRLACSRLCSDASSCNSFQHSMSIETSKPVCYTFSSYTHSRVMVPSPQTNYYEKRSCMNVFDTTATIIYTGIHEMLLISRSTVRRMSYTLVDNQYTFNIYWTGPVSSVFPGFLSDVEGATECYGNYTTLFYGNSVSCYSRNGSSFTQETCPTDIFTSYFTTSGFSNLDAITSVDDSFLEVHVFKNNIVHHLQYDETEAKYLFQTSMQLTDPNSSWSEGPHGITALSYVKNGAYFMFETHKWYFYNTIPYKSLPVIFYVCN